MSSASEDAALPAPRTLAGPRSSAAGPGGPGPEDAAGFYAQVQAAVPRLAACGVAGPARFVGGPEGLVRAELLGAVPGAAASCAEGVLAEGPWPATPGGMEVEVDVR